MKILDLCFIKFRDFFWKNIFVFEKFIYIFLIFLLIFPVVILCFFCHPACDDFGYAKSFLEFGAVNSFFYTYFTWTGRFTVNFLNQSFFNPLAYKNFVFFYKCFTFLNLLFFLFSLFIFLTKINKKFFSLDKKKLFLLGFSFLISFFSGMPSLVEGFYWYSSYIQYIFPMSIFFILGYFWLNYIEPKKFENIKNFFMLIKHFVIFVIILLFNFLLSGFYEPFSIMLIFINLIYFIFAYKNKKVYKNKIYSFLVASILGFLVMYFAPGNKARLDCFDNRSHIFIMIFNSFRDVFSIFRWFFSINILLFFILYLFFDIKIKISNLSLKRAIYFVTSLILLFYFLMLYATGGVPPFRLENIIYFFFLILNFLIVNLICNNFFNDEFFKTKVFINLKKYKFLFLFFIFFHILLVNGNIKDAYLDFFSGKIFVYDRELKNIYGKLQSSEISKISKLVINDLTFYPKSISLPFKDLKNEIKEFFDKEIILEKINMNRINEHNLDQNIRKVIKNYLK